MTRSTRIVSILDELQMGAASLARLLGVAQVPDDREVSGRTPSGEKIDADDVRRTSRVSVTILHGVDLSVGVGERIAMVGPLGAGKVDAGLAAGRHPSAADRRGDRGGVGLVELPLGDLRGHVALVTQEHHVFVGNTLRENLALAAPTDASDADIRAALDAVDALEWVEGLPRAWTLWSAPVAASGRRAGPADRAGPTGAGRPTHAGARRGHLADRPACGSAPGALAGRGTRGPATAVIAIAYWPFPAHHADRVAVAEDGVISEFGSHDELVAAGGPYAALWDSWNGQASRVARGTSAARARAQVE